jgi:GTP-binding protein
MIDMAGTDARDPRDDYKHLLTELELYDPALLDKPRLVVANKMDVDAAVAPGKKFKSATRRWSSWRFPACPRTGIPEAEERIVKARAKLRAQRKEIAKADRIQT